jgi:hypothetical protein
VTRAAKAAKGPALTAGAAAAAFAGGLALRKRFERPRVLGVKVPRSIVPKSIGITGMYGVVKQVGKATKQIGETSKGISKDLDRLGDQAERVGKILS